MTTTIKTLKRLLGMGPRISREQAMAAFGRRYASFNELLQSNADRHPGQAGRGPAGRQTSGDPSGTPHRPQGHLPLRAHGGLPQRHVARPLQGTGKQRGRHRPAHRERAGKAHPRRRQRAHPAPDGSGRQHGLQRGRQERQPGRTEQHAGHARAPRLRRDHPGQQPGPAAPQRPVQEDPQHPVQGGRRRAPQPAGRRPYRAEPDPGGSPTRRRGKSPARRLGRGLRQGQPGAGRPALQRRGRGRGAVLRRAVPEHPRRHAREPAHGLQACAGQSVLAPGPGLPRPQRLPPGRHQHGHVLPQDGAGQGGGRGLLPASRGPALQLRHDPGHLGPGRDGG